MSKTESLRWYAKQSTREIAQMWLKTTTKAHTFEAKWLKEYVSYGKKCCQSLAELKELIWNRVTQIAGSTQGYEKLPRCDWLASRIEWKHTAVRDERDCSRTTWNEKDHRYTAMKSNSVHQKQSFTRIFRGQDPGTMWVILASNENSQLFYAEWNQVSPPLTCKRQRTSCQFIVVFLNLITAESLKHGSRYKTLLEKYHN